MRQTRSKSAGQPARGRWMPGWSGCPRSGWMASALLAATTLLAGAAVAGPKGTVVVRPLGDVKITIDGDIKDWPLDSYKAASEQPLFPEGQNKDSSTAQGDHIVFDAKRVGFFNETGPGAFTTGDNDYGVSLYFAYDSQFLYILGVFIDDVARGDKDPSDDGTQGFYNDGVELLMDLKGDGTGCFDAATFPSEVQLAVSLNDNFKASGAASDILGARQLVLSNGDPDLRGPDGIWQHALDAVGGPTIVAKKYDDLRAAGAKNPEIAAKPNVTFKGYAIEMRVPFKKDDKGIPNFTPDHDMGFEMFFRDVDNGDTNAASDPGMGAADESWALWAQSSTVACDDSSLKTSLYNTGNWGKLVFDKTDFLGPAPKP